MTRPCMRCRGTGVEPDWGAVGIRCRKAREAKGWTLRELAQRTHISAAYLCDMEKGRRGWQSPTAVRITKLLGVANFLNVAALSPSAPPTENG